MLKNFINSFCLAVANAYEEYQSAPSQCCAGDIYFGKSPRRDIVCQFLVSPDNPNATLIIRGTLLSEMFRVYTETGEAQPVAEACTYLIPRISKVIQDYPKSRSPEIIQLEKEFDRAALNGILAQVKDPEAPETTTN